MSPSSFILQKPSYVERQLCWQLPLEEASGIVDGADHCAEKERERERERNWEEIEDILVVEER